MEPPALYAFRDSAHFATLLAKRMGALAQTLRTHHFLASYRSAVLVDDVASSGSTLATAAAALRRMGISTVDAVVVHALFAPRVVSCNSVPHRTNRIDLTSLLAVALRRGQRRAGTSSAATARRRTRDGRS